MGLHNNLPDYWNNEKNIVRRILICDELNPAILGNAMHIVHMKN